MLKSMILARSYSDSHIGINGELPWKLKADLARFKKITMGHTLIMGRKTYESLPGKLPGRRLIVVTRDDAYRLNLERMAIDTGDCQVYCTNSIWAAISMAERYEETECFFIGGATLFEQAIVVTDRIYETVVYDGELSNEGTVYLSPRMKHYLNTGIWYDTDSESKEVVKKDADNQYESFFRIRNRILPCGYGNINRSLSLYGDWIDIPFSNPHPAWQREEPEADAEFIKKYSKGIYPVKFMDGRIVGMMKNLRAGEHGGYMMSFKVIPDIDSSRTLRGMVYAGMEFDMRYTNGEFVIEYHPENINWLGA